MTSSPLASGSRRLVFGLLAALLALPLAAQTPIGGVQSGTLTAGVYHTTGNLSVAVSTTWTLNPGVIIKFSSSGHSLTVDGTLAANGTSPNHVVFTSIQDDSAGGDTNGNGASSGAAGEWQGINFGSTSDASSLTYTEVRFGGSSFVSNVELVDANIAMSNCTIRNCYTDGMDLNGSTSAPAVSTCAFNDNGGAAVTNARITAVPGFTNNTASGNASNGGNYIAVTNGLVSSSLTIGPASILNGALAMASSIQVDGTLTLNAGVVIKFFNSGYNVTVNGTLVTSGTSGSPVVFTSSADDSAGGNTNGGAVTSGSPGEWQGMYFNAASDASSLTHTEVRYGGSSFVSNVELVDANITMSNCTIRHCYTDGMDLNAGTSVSHPTVSNCTFSNNGGAAVKNTRITAIPGFTNNAASGNAGNYIAVTDGLVSSSLTIGATSIMNGALAMGTSLQVDGTLTLGAGVVIKFFNSGFNTTVNGTLLTNGTSGSPVVFTSGADDSAGGDTNNNGASSGTAGEWQGITFTAAADASSLTYTEVRYGGASFVSNVELVDANITMSNCTIRHCYTDGMDLNGSTAAPTVSNCTFSNNGGAAIKDTRITAVPGFTNNAASGNGGNYISVTNGLVSSSLTIGPSSILNGALAMATSLQVDGSLTLNAGVVIKFSNSGFNATVNGTLLTNGTLGSPVVFTSAEDDSAGGDTNNNGASVGSPGQWQGMYFNAASDASALTYTEVRYGGGSFVSNVELVDANIAMSNCTIRDCYTDGMDLNGSTAAPSVSKCTFSNNGGYAVTNMRIASVPGFVNNTAAGNGGNYLRVTDATVSSNLTIGAQSIMNGALVTAAGISVQAAAVLTVNQGVVIKFQSGGLGVVVDGAMNLRGTAYEPVVLTSPADDTFGGDTNNNGPSVGSTAEWQGVTFNAAALASTLENVVIRYTGSSFVPALTCSSPNVTLKSVRVDDAYDRGFVLGALAANATNLVAWSCGTHGIQMTGGSFGLVHATSAGNGTGIRAEAGWSGTVMNSISHGNTTNFSNFGAGGAVSFSNGGFGGSNGNLNVDPQFTSLATGDLHLLPTSPCINAGDLFTAFAVQKDHDESSRILDSALSGIPGADMGAFEVGAWDMNVFGVPRIGTTLTFVVNGPTGDSIYALGILDGIYGLPPYGILLCGAIPYVTVIQLVPGTIPTNTALPIPIPFDPGLVGLTAGVQTLTTPTGNSSVGNFTQLCRVTVRP